MIPAYGWEGSTCISAVVLPEVQVVAEKGYGYGDMGYYANIEGDRMGFVKSSHFGIGGNGEGEHLG